MTVHVHAIYSAKFEPRGKKYIFRLQVLHSHVRNVEFYCHQAVKWYKSVPSWYLDVNYMYYLYTVHVDEI